MGAAKGAPVAEEIKVLADGLGGDVEGFDQLLHRDPALFPGEFDDLSLSHLGIHGSLPLSVRE
jgi:hypothetical protein